MNAMGLKIKKDVDPSQFEIGVIIGRFQVHNLHEAHRGIIDMVCANHKKVIMFLGIPKEQYTPENPLDFATRKIMIQELYPNIIILPLNDQREDPDWSQTLDEQIKIPFGQHSALLYGGRDSFISHYKGKHKTTELETDIFYSGTEIRRAVSREILATADFRAGIINGISSKRPVTYPTVDIVAHNEKGQILLAKKPKEKKYRFIGGFVDRTDENWEHAAKREFMEETGGCEVGGLRYIASAQIKDWRYAKSKSGIMTTLFLGTFVFGSIQPSDDIEVLEWIDVKKLNMLNETDALAVFIMEEHLPLMKILLDKIKSENLIPIF